MARWEGNARGRLERAALDLFLEQGYDRTTIAQITQRANLTERSFYRWFSDKREVLFDGEGLEMRFVSAIEASPVDSRVLPTLLAAFAIAPEVLRPRVFLRERATVIAANPPLLERELMKLASLSEALTAALVRRGHERQTSRLAVDVAVAVLRLATERWVVDDHADFAHMLSESAVDLHAVTAVDVDESTPTTRR